MSAPSLAMIPSAIADSKVYSVLPNNGDGDFSFNRDSSATRIGQNGLIETVATDEPRLNYDILNGVVQSCPSLLLEPASTNLLTYSEDFSQWTSDTNTSITSNSIISPDGTQNADKLIAGSSSARQAIKLSVTANGDISMSVFAKKGEYSVIQFSDAINGSFFINFDLQTGGIGSSNTMQGKIENVGNDWYRCSASYNTSNPIISFRLSIAESSTSARLVNFAGNGSDGLYIYGAQLENELFSTSLINTSGSTVTRAAETCNGAVTASTFNDSEGVLYAEISALANSGNFRQLTISDSSTSDRVSIDFTSTDNQIRSFSSSGGSTVANMTGSVSNATEFNKVAVKYKLNDYALWINGVEVATDSSAAAPVGLSELAFDNGTGGNPFQGNVKDIRVYNEALTDSQLQTLTS